MVAFASAKVLFPGVAQLVARLLWEQDAAGSNPVTRTMRSVLIGFDNPVMDTPHFLCSKLGNGFIAEQAPLLDAKELDPVLCKQVDVPLCHAPLAAYAVNALDQHQIHLTSEDGLCDLLERRAV